jgi:hypothetical protein
MFLSWGAAMRKIILLTLILILLAFNQNPAQVNASAVSGRTFDPPIAYIGWDGNIWMTDLKSWEGVRLTTDGKPLWFYSFRFEVADKDHFYSNLQWSPNREMLSALDHSYEAGFTVSLFEPTGARTKYDVSTGYWSPDGMHFAEADCYQQLTIREFSIITSEWQEIGKSECGGPDAIGDGANIPLNVDLLLFEIYGSENPLRRHRYRFEITAIGYLTSNLVDNSETNFPWKMLSTNGEILWTGFFDEFVFSPDRKVAYSCAINEKTNNCSPVLVDLATGKATPLQYSVSNDRNIAVLTVDRKSVIYSVTELNEISYDYNKVSLWQLSLETGKTEKVLERTGTGIGAIVPMPDSTGAIISLVTSRALAGTSTHPAYGEGYPHVELLYVNLNTREVRFIAAGGQPAVGTKPFTAIPVN